MLSNRQADVEEAALSSKDDTKKSFDFTGEFKNFTSLVHRIVVHSFMEQLEHAFRTPAKVDLRYDFGNFLATNAPPAPMNSRQDELLRAGESAFSLPSEYESRELLSMGLSLEVNAELSFLPGTDSYSATASVDDLLPQMMRKPRAVGSRP